MGTSSNPSFTIEVSARSRHVGWVRAFAGAVAAAHGLPPDEVSDVKLAASELAGSIAASHPGAELTLSASVTDRRLSYHVAPWVEAPPSEDELSPWELVGALFEDAGIEGDGAFFTVPLE